MYHLYAISLLDVRRVSSRPYDDVPQRTIGFETTKTDHHLVFPRVREIHYIIIAGTTNLGRTWTRKERFVASLGDFVIRKVAVADGSKRAAKISPLFFAELVAKGLYSLDRTKCVRISFTV